MTLQLTSGAAVSRRRFLSISASMAGASAVSGSRAAGSHRTFSWRGVALGAHASLSIQHHDEAEANAAITACLSEVARLEMIFSLHRPGSALSRLNGAGRIEDAPLDLRILLSEALELAARTQGAFDPTVQPLWELYARHFLSPGAAPEGPSDVTLEVALQRVGWHHVEMREATIAFARPGMALTLNGIAQGYITDKAGDVLRACGFTNVLANLGEQLALGPKWDGSAWRVGITDPAAPGELAETIALHSGALATSGGYGTSFDGARRFTHILDPRTGRPARSWASISVHSDRATTADGLSTALMVLPAADAGLLLGANRAYAVSSRDGAAFWISGISTV